MQRIAWVFGALLLTSVAAFGDGAKDALADDDGAAVDTPASSKSTTDADAKADSVSLGGQMEDIKHGLVELKRDLAVLEEDLLYPASSQVAVFLSMDVGEFFALDSIVLKIDDKEVSNYLYTAREETALVKGGAQRLYVGNLKSGQHELVAVFTGKGPNQRDYRRGASLKFEKGLGAKYLELKITDRARRAQPEFEIKDWE
jgi:hypothetical protein